MLFLGWGGRILLPQTLFKKRREANLSILEIHSNFKESCKLYS
jgi:hypothetical protein